MNRPQQFHKPAHGEEENALALPDAAQAPAKFASDDDFAEVAQSSSFLPFIQVLAKSSDLATQEGFTAGDLILKKGQDSIVNLGKEVNGLVVGWRFRAMHIGDDDVLSVFDHKSPEFAKIRAASEVQGNQGDMYGIEFLVYSPAIQPGGFALYFMCNSSSRREAPNLKVIFTEWKNGTRKMPAFTLSARLNKGRKYSWFIPVIKTCSNPIAPMPDPEELNRQIETFNNPPADQRESVETDEADRDR